MPEPIRTLAPQSSPPPGSRTLADELRLSVLPSRAVVQLRVAARSLKTIGSIRIGARELSGPANSASGDDPVSCRIAPDAWLVFSSRQDPAELEDAVARACSRRACAVTGLSDAFATLALDGPRAMEVLARGCGLELTGAACGIGYCARTRFAQLPVVLRRTTVHRFELVVDRSAAKYLFDWIQDAAAGLD